ncbi:peptidase C14 caspase catalytic subunit p20 [Candidatus Thiomargarita nelsonii]|uniref:Peptidase C14 caspase catalytic subunit p20 n=1 Tax=Candidatus Thiomargarita nelsonii TaxID=1003181 RepID=A0A176S6H4_9GAMM|nr:peptidase C14 caspase catalytic subunit p20 [Candidatus Thiomargarita nelsonii]
MKTKILLIALLPLFIACGSVETRLERSDNKGKRYALVIGNANYKGDPNILPLNNPVNDARDMKLTLQTVGFEVIYREDAASREEMIEAVQIFREKLHSGSVGVFYYAGHGVQVNGENYLIPTRAKLPSEKEVKDKTMSANYVLAQMEQAGNGSNIIILDACRDNPLPKETITKAPLSTETRGLGKTGDDLAENIRSIGTAGLAKMRSPKGSIIAFATAPDKPAMDGKGRNGTYTKHLLKAIKMPGLTVETMFKQVRELVSRDTKDQQIPWENSSLTGDFCFSGCQQQPKTEIIMPSAN